MNKIRATFTKISDEKVNSKHVLILSNGFLSENYDNKTVWKDIIEKYPYLEIYIFEWMSSSPSETFNKCVNKLGLTKLA